MTKNESLEGKVIRQNYQENSLEEKLLAKENNYKAVLTQKMISEATNIAEYSIRDHYVNLLKPRFINN